MTTTDTIEIPNAAELRRLIDARRAEIGELKALLRVAEVREAAELAGTLERGAGTTFRIRLRTDAAHDRDAVPAAEEDSSCRA